ncbi:hypothetical protein ACFSEO_00395 [Agromyces cerinus subsp. nitratus]|uniref:hypothetical protein n=1 Tax=Agromyces cerinus TaxID=33878 RepID=UPI00362CF85C
MRLASTAPGEIRIFSTIALPIMGPALLTVFLSRSSASGTTSSLPMVTLNDAELWPAMLGLYFWGSQPMSSTITS